MRTSRLRLAPTPLPPRRLRFLLCSLAAGLAGASVVSAALLLATPTSAPIERCVRYPLFDSVFVCTSGVYLRKGRRMQFMGRSSALKPMPSPRREAP